MKTALLGGTFNPIHKGHLLIAESALKTAGLDRVIFIPCATPPHKKDDELIDGKHRKAMIRLAIKGTPQFEVSSLELERKGGPSYTVDTLRQMQNLYPNDQFHFIVGSDNFHEIGTWKSFPDLIRLCKFLVIERPGCKLTLPPKSVNKEMLPLLNFSVFQGPTIEISSSEIRHSIRNGKDASPFLPKGVAEYIKNHQLYLN